MHELQHQQSQQYKDNAFDQNRNQPLGTEHIAKLTLAVQYN